MPGAQKRERVEHVPFLKPVKTAMAYLTAKPPEDGLHANVNLLNQGVAVPPRQEAGRYLSSTVVAGVLSFKPHFHATTAFSVPLAKSAAADFVLAVASEKGESVMTLLVPNWPIF